MCIYIYILQLQIVETSVNRNQIFNSGLAKRGKIIYVFGRVLCDKKSSLLILPSRLYLEGYRARSCIDSEDSKHTEKSPKQPPFSLLEALEKIKTCRCTVRIVSFVPYRIPPDPRSRRDAA